MPTEPVAPDKIELTEEEFKAAWSEAFPLGIWEMAWADLESEDPEVHLTTADAYKFACAVLKFERNRVKGERCKWIKSPFDSRYAHYIPSCREFGEWPDECAVSQHGSRCDFCGKCIEVST